MFDYIKGDKDSIMGLPIKQIKDYINNYKNMKKKKFVIIGDPISHSFHLQCITTGLKSIILMRNTNFCRYKEKENSKRD